MKARSIIISKPLIPPTLDGVKTMTRRCLKHGGKYIDILEASNKYAGEWIPWIGGIPCRSITCPYGQPGDLLYVKEACWMWGCWRKNGTTKTGRQKWRFEPDENDPRTVFEKPAFTVKRNGDTGWVYRHARFMPRVASRITLKLTDVLVERVQDISEDDAIAEGVKAVSLAAVPRQAAWSNRQDFSRLWDSINAERGHSWESNPWVWVLSFEAIQANVDDVMRRAA